MQKEQGGRQSGGTTLVNLSRDNLARHIKQRRTPLPELIVGMCRNGVDGQDTLWRQEAEREEKDEDSLTNKIDMKGNIELSTKFRFTNFDFDI